MSEYKGYGRGEKLLEEQIPKFDKFLAPKMLQEARALKDQIERFGTEPSSFTIRFMHAETAYWEITFTHPVIQYVPECFGCITKNIPYYFAKGQWLEHVPSYIPNINHVAMNTIYNGGSSEFTNNAGGLFAKYIHVNGIPMTFYSYNILLRHNVKKKYLDESIHTHVKKCFDYCYWRFPTPLDQDDGSCIDNLIYATTSKIREILILRKTLVKILSIERRTESRSLLENNVRGKFVDVLLICDDKTQLMSQRRRIFILEHIVESTNEGDIMNAVLVQIGQKEKKKGIVLIGKIGDTVNPDKSHAVVSVILSKMLQNIEDHSSPTKITDIDRLKIDITNFFQTNHEFFDGMLGWRKDIPKKISKSLDELFPIFIEDCGSVYQISPTILTFLATISPQALVNKKILIAIAKLLDTLKINSKFWGQNAIRKLSLSDSYKEILTDPSSFSNELLRDCPRLVNRIVYSRIFSKHYTHMK